MYVYTVWSSACEESQSFSYSHVSHSHPFRVSTCACEIQLKVTQQTCQGLAKVIVSHSQWQSTYNPRSPADSGTDLG